MQDLELIEFFLEPDKKNGIERISIVGDPAMEGEDGLKFFNKIKREEKTVGLFEKVDDGGEIAYEIVGLIMRPNKKIVRKYNQQYFECIFSEQTVRNSLISYAYSKNLNKSNLEHKSSDLKDIIFYENWIITDENINNSVALGFKDVKKGDWWGRAKVFNPSLYEYLKTRYNNGHAGYSLEGNFDFDFSTMSMRKVSDEDVLKFINNILNDKKLTDEEKFFRINGILNV